MTRGIHRPETGQAVIQVQSIQSSVCHHRASNTCTTSHIRDHTRLRTPVQYSEQSSVKKIHRCLHSSTTHTTPFLPCHLCLAPCLQLVHAAIRTTQPHDTNTTILMPMRTSNMTHRRYRHRKATEHHQVHRIVHRAIPLIL
jgi:hypothetical protein